MFLMILLLDPLFNGTRKQGNGNECVIIRWAIVIVCSWNDTTYEIYTIRMEA